MRIKTCIFVILNFIIKLLWSLLFATVNYESNALKIPAQLKTLAVSQYQCFTLV